MVLYIKTYKDILKLLKKLGLGAFMAVPKNDRVTLGEARHRPDRRLPGACRAITLFSSGKDFREMLLFNN